jgi:hypothetical protein
LWLLGLAVVRALRIEARQSREGVHWSSRFYIIGCLGFFVGVHQADLVAVALYVIEKGTEGIGIFLVQQRSNGVPLHTFEYQFSATGAKSARALRSKWNFF